MQENTARKRASLFQKPDRWGEVVQQSKPRKHQRRRRPDLPAYHLPSDSASSFANVDVIHPHVPAMKDDASSPTSRRRSGESPKRTQGLNHDSRTSTQDARYSSSGSDLDDYLEQEENDDEEAGLTHEERKRKRKWIWRHMRLDGRVAGDGHSIKNQTTMWSGDMIRANAINALFIGLWYTFSIGISVYNTWMFSSGGLHFPFPLFTTCAHMVVQFTLSGAVLFFLPQFRPKAGPSTSSNAHGYTHVESDDDVVENSAHDGPVLTKWFYISRIGPCGAATALDIGLGNFSLRYISLTFYTMCKSSVLGFVLLFAFLFRLEKPSWKLFSVIAIMTLGVIMMVAGEVDFQLTGFILIMSAAFMSGFRWSLTQILLLRNPATSNPFSSIFFLTPVMFLCLLALAIPIEGLSELWTGFQEMAEIKGYLGGVILMISPGILAFLMVASEFALLQRTSVVTLSVCGIFKEVLTIATAANTFGDRLSPVNISGLFVTIVAIAAYNVLKYQKMRVEFEKGQKGSALQDMDIGDTRAGASDSHAASSYPSHSMSGTSENDLQR